MFDKKKFDRQEIVRKVKYFKYFENSKSRRRRQNEGHPLAKGCEFHPRVSGGGEHVPSPPRNRTVIDFARKSLYSVSRDGSGGNRGLSSRAEIGWRTVLKGSNDVTMTSVRVVDQSVTGRTVGNGNSIGGRWGCPIVPRQIIRPVIGKPAPGASKYYRSLCDLIQTDGGRRREILRFSLDWRAFPTFLSAILSLVSSSLTSDVSNYRPPSIHPQIHPANLSLFQMVVWPTFSSDRKRWMDSIFLRNRKMITREFGHLYGQIQCLISFYFGVLILYPSTLLFLIYCI